VSTSQLRLERADGAQVFVAAPEQFPWGTGLRFLTTGGVPPRATGSATSPTIPRSSRSRLWVRSPVPSRRPASSVAMRSLAGGRNCHQALETGLPRCFLGELLIEMRMAADSAWYYEQGKEWTLLTGHRRRARRRLGNGEQHPRRRAFRLRAWPLRHRRAVRAAGDRRRALRECGTRSGRRLALEPAPDRPDCERSRLRGGAAKRRQRSGISDAGRCAAFSSDPLRRPGTGGFIPGPPGGTGQGDRRRQGRAQTDQCIPAADGNHARALRRCGVLSAATDQSYGAPGRWPEGDCLRGSMVA